MHYKDTNNTVHWLDDEKFEYLLPKGSVKISESEAAELSKPKHDSKAEALAYLRSTDWYVTRKSETGKEIPEDVVAKRNAARLSLN